MAKTVGDAVKVAMIEVQSGSYRPIKAGENGWMKIDKERDWDVIDKKIANTLISASQGNCRWPLLFTGEAGAGKTCASLAVYDRFGGHWHGFQEYCDLLNEAAFDRLFDHLGYKVFPRQIWHDWRESKIGILDDVGTRTRVTDHQYETLKRALDNRDGKPTIITTNLDLTTIEKVFDDRIASRLGGGTVIEFKGDRRVG